MYKSIGLAAALTAFSSLSQDLYDIDHITVIEIEFVETNWDALMDANDLADDGTKLIGTVTIDGTFYDSVGVAYKGNSSYDAAYPKNPLNIEFNYVLDQLYQGRATLKLSSGRMDPSFVREVLAYEMGRNYMDMPLCNYAKVYINGDYYGLFSSSEAIDGRYGERRVYANKNNPRFKCNPPAGMGPGNEPSLKYVGTDSSLYDGAYEIKSDYGWAEFIEFMSQLSSSPSTIENYLDLDRALWMLAFNNVTGNMDSYSGPTKQNYYMIQADNGRWCPIIWDQNEGIGGFENVDGGGPAVLSDITDADIYLRSTDPAWPLINKLLSNTSWKKMYLAHMKTIVEEMISSGDYYSRAQELQTIIDTEVTTEPNPVYPYSDFINNIDNAITGFGGAYGIAQVLDGRESYLLAQPEWSLVAPTITPAATSPATVPTGTTVTFLADIVSANFVYLGYRSYPGDAFIKLQMFDDGAHGDGTAGDGQYGVDVTVGAEDLQYYFYAENANAGIFSPVRAEHEFYSLVIDSDVVINELMPKNYNTAADEEGKFEDWIELYNNTSSSIDLTGYWLSDDPLDLMKWEFPSTSIGANGYLIIWCDQDTLDLGLHANFQLTSGGETYILSDAPGTAINAVKMPEIETSSTYGRYVNGTGGCIRMTPTYNAENSYSAVGIEEAEPVVNIQLYPNPASDKFHIVTNSDVQEGYTVYDVNGRVVLNGSVTSATEIDASQLQTGMYFVQLPGMNWVGKLVKL